MSLRKRLLAGFRLGAVTPGPDSGEPPPGPAIGAPRTGSVLMSSPWEAPRRAGCRCCVAGDVRAEISASSSASFVDSAIGEPLDAVRELKAGRPALGRTLERALGPAQERERPLRALAAHQHGAEAVG